MKKKKLKIFLIIILTLILVGAGYLLYIFKFKTYEVADEEVEQIIEDPYAIELPDGTTITLNENGEIVDATGSATNGVSVDGSKVEGTSSSDKDVSSASGSGTTETEEKATVGSIKQKYVQTLENLQSQADSKLNTLVSHAKKEYNDKKANGEGIDYGYFFTKYTGAAKELEVRTDAVFEGVIKVAEKDLVANGFDKSYAQSFIADYEAKKKERKDSLLSKALSQ